MKPVRMVCVMILLPLLILTGCWDRKEIEERATIVGLAIDVAKPNEHPIPLTHPEEIKVPTSNIGKIKVTAQLAVPGQIPLGPSQGGDSSPKDKVWVVEAIGNTMDDAVQGLQQQLAHKIFFGQLQVIILSDEIARRGIEHINEFLRRRPEIRRTAWMAVNHEDAAQTMQVAPKLEQVPAIYLSTMFEEAVKMGKFPENDLGKFWIHTSNKGYDGYLPYITVKENENIEISGLAYFSGNKMVGKTKPYQIAYFNGLMGQNPGGAAAVIWLSNNESVMFQSTKRKVDYHVRLKNGIPHFDINVDIWGIIREKNSQKIKLDDSKMIEKIETLAGKQIEHEMVKLIKETQDKKSDIFGFGEYVRGDLSKFWDDHVETSDDWKEIFQKMTLNVTTKIHIERVGMKAS